MNVCYGCLENKKIVNNYCTKCAKAMFGGKAPASLKFDKKEFYIKRRELADRMSISGVQDKISLAFDTKELIPTAIDGKYILKPIPLDESIKHQEDVVFNEHLSMLISKNIFKIRTANCGLIKFSNGELAYITKRFDYSLDNIKYDQEDFASVLEVTKESHGENYKYDAKTYLDCANAIKLNIPAKVVALEDFFKRLILNYLICNGDAHLKNFSIYSGADIQEYILSPNYDILNTKFHVNEKYGDTAMKLTEAYTDVFMQVGYYSHHDFKEFANTLGIMDKRFDKIIKLACDSEIKVEQLLKNSFLSKDAQKFYIINYKDRLKRLLYKI